MSHQNRSCLRIPTDFEAHIITHAEQALTVNVDNLSVTGFHILSEIAFPKDSHINLKICLPKTSAFFSLDCKVLRVHDLTQTNKKYISALGVQIINPSKNWAQTAGPWIESQFELPATRKVAACLIWVMALALAFKAALTALGLQTLDLALNEFIGFELVNLGAGGSIFICTEIALTNILLFCGLQALKPTLRDRFFFTSTAAISVIAFFSIRLFLKLPLLSGSYSQQLLYGLDVLVILISLAGAALARQLENQYHHFQRMTERERIYPKISV